MMNLVRKILYGDYGDKEHTGTPNSNDQNPSLGVGGIGSAAVEDAWPLWEVFIRSKQGLDHKHAGSLHAPDAKMAIENARDVYTRRQEGTSIWVVESVNIHASSPDEAASLYDPANDKIYRHPSFYELPEALKHM